MLLPTRYDLRFAEETKGYYIPQDILCNRSNELMRADELKRALRYDYTHKILQHAPVASYT
jgi:hypothetical protein